ncbi:Gfo/Idh/MocA family protein [Poseidonocella sp. HB161398]|uniref:Gfo/Idh/MocA family protein n=1 Tax=Poseidonocella sp. HB161398 TaxID=2320855 RepID=UPI001108B04D|nr:Gfo/Idh/MocA family oxidoreductase [Poseidonocella sp. HB161398]
MGFSATANLRHPPLGRRLRLGFVGGGRGGLVGEWHASGARLSNHWDIVAGALSSDPANAAASARDWCIAEDRSYGTYGAMAAAETARADGIEAVTICTPNWTHFDMAETFLKAGIDVILDKPMVNTLEDARALVKLQRETGLVLAMTYPYTYHPMVRQAKLMVAAGMIGKVRQVHVEYVQDWATGPADPAFKGAAWRRDTAKVGRASATGDIGTHAYHILKYVTGEDVARLRADFHVCGAEKALEDTAFVNLALANGAPGLLWVTQAAPGNFCGLRLRVFGETGALEWDQETPEELRFAPLDAPVQILTRGAGAGMLPEAEKLIVLPRGHGEALSDAWANLYAEIGLAVAARRTGQRPNDMGLHLTDVAEGARGVAFVHACADSHEAGGTWVDLDAEV